MVLGLPMPASAFDTEDRSRELGSLSGVRMPSLLSALEAGEADRAGGRREEAMVGGSPGMGTNVAMAQQSSKPARRADKDLRQRHDRTTGHIDETTLQHSLSTCKSQRDSLRR